MSKCPECKYSEKVLEAGNQYTFRNPNGDEVTRQYGQTVYICRANPPISGDWPQVTADDWCGMFEE